MKTRDELLAMANDIIERIEAYALNDPKPEADVIIAGATFAQACVMLAKEMREGEQSPTYDQAEVTIDAIRSVEAAITYGNR